MKKIVLFILVFGICSSLIACGKRENNVLNSSDGKLPEVIIVEPEISYEELSGEEISGESVLVEENFSSNEEVSGEEPSGEETSTIQESSGEIEE
ncbi:MAG: hypothetical protein IJ220_00960 [Clostridia bacterium]|nr:hypothetical protein [Clostridia bacterium]